MPSFRLSGIEHPASLSREDKSVQTDQSKPSPAQVNRTLSCSQEGKITLPQMMECRRRTEAHSVSVNASISQGPNWTKTKVIAFFEAILATRVFASNGNDFVRADHLRSFLLDEKFPQDWVKHGGSGWGVPELIAATVSASASNVWSAIRDGAKALETYFDIPPPKA